MIGLLVGLLDDEGLTVGFTVGLKVGSSVGCSDT
jgi:hypothetical protein